MDLRRAPARGLTFAAIVLVALASASCKPAGETSKAFKTIRIYDLLVATPEAAAHVHNPSFMRVGEYAVAGEARQALFLHPAGSLEFPLVRLSSRAELCFWIGLDSSVWDKAGDGVEFSVFVSRANNARTKVYSRYLDPKHNPDDRRWVEGRVSLRAFRNQDVQIILATEPGSANDVNFDWALWAEPQIMLHDEMESGHE
jgi:hypothetical protein